VNASAKVPPRKQRPLNVGDHCDGCGNLADDEVLGVDHVHLPTVSAEVVEVEDPFCLVDGAK
jgi:hypothetical protein